ncbi:hypothetical protein SAMN05444159_0178 [Bradyrhizobium lablabi]|uniref:Uncharacterized protein n=1 Tax=Bradyrhizobium lablabi TaxID=722472 RepID=A0A1M6I0G3_9BRAD|nr:hypothetical protein SAMN05444159_0178 [Bradyrhizobium lablabi]
MSSAGSSNLATTLMYVGIACSYGCSCLRGASRVWLISYYQAWLLCFVRSFTIRNES